MANISTTNRQATRPSLSGIWWAIAMPPDSSIPIMYCPVIINSVIYLKPTGVSRSISPFILATWSIKFEVMTLLHTRPFKFLLRTKCSSNSGAISLGDTQLPSASIMPNLSQSGLHAIPKCIFLLTTNFLRSVKLTGPALGVCPPKRTSSPSWMPSTVTPCFSKKSRK